MGLKAMQQPWQLTHKAYHGLGCVLTPNYYGLGNGHVCMPRPWQPTHKACHGLDCMPTPGCHGLGTIRAYMSWLRLHVHTWLPRLRQHTRGHAMALTA